MIIRFIDIMKNSVMLLSIYSKVTSLFIYSYNEVLERYLYRT